MSKGRVVVEQSGRTTIDGNLLNDTGFLPDSEDSDSVERTLYVAGQIASAIKKGKWQKKLLSRETEDAVLMRGKKDKTVLVVRDSPQGQIIKIVGTFDFDSTKQANKLKGKEREEANLVAEIEKSASRVCALFFAKIWSNFLRNGKERLVSCTIKTKRNELYCSRERREKK
jgi:hypothetical protein